MTSSHSRSVAEGGGGRSQDLLVDLFPNDSGVRSPNAAHNFIANTPPPTFEAGDVVGRPYLWAQVTCSLCLCLSVSPHTFFVLVDVNWAQIASAQWLAGRDMLPPPPPSSSSTTSTTNDMALDDATNALTTATVREMPSVSTVLRALRRRLASRAALAQQIKSLSK